MTKKPKTKRNDDKSQDSNDQDLLKDALAAIIAAALKGKLEDIMPRYFLVDNKNMALLVKVGRVYEHYAKHDTAIDKELKQKTAEALAAVFHEAIPLTGEQMDMIAAGLDALEKEQNKPKADEDKTSAEVEDEQIAGKTNASA